MTGTSRLLRSGCPMPAIGLGTFGSDRYDEQTVAAAVRQGIRLGYRLVDCAAVYGNEAAIGPVLADAIRGGVPRSEFFIVSKVWNNCHKPADVRLSLAQTLKDLQLDYLDLFLIHWPFRNVHPRGAPPDFHDPSAQPYQHDDYMQTWHQLEKLQQAGLIRHIGTSNMTIPKLELLFRDCRIMPAVNEMELHPTFQQQDLFDFCLRHGIQPVGYSPLGSPSRPERDRSAADVVDMEQPAIRRIAAERGWHPAQVCLKWAVQRGQIPIPFSVKPAQLAANLAVLDSAPLSERAMAEIARADCDCRLIKGQVFLWNGARDWRDLWDLDGVIAGRA